LLQRGVVFRGAVVRAGLDHRSHQPGLFAQLCLRAAWSLLRVRAAIDPLRILTECTSTSSRLPCFLSVQRAVHPQGWVEPAAFMEVGQSQQMMADDPQIQVRFSRAGRIS
jgi:hypothetical protein